jgi:hypothetical protein
VAVKESELTAEKFAKVFIESYFRLHGLPEIIVSDRDPRFTSEFWQHLTELWQTKTAMSTAFHPETDGLAEKANEIVERYLRTFAAGNERKWDELLPLAEFSYNSHVHKAHGMTPFEADLGYNPRMPMDILAVTGQPKPGGGTRAVSFATHMNDIVQELRNSLKISRDSYMQEANKKRQSHNFQPGDKVMLNTRNLPLTYGNADTDETARLSRTLQQRFVGPFTLGRQFGENAFELTDIPDHLRVHRTFNVKLFKRCTIDETRAQPPPPPVRVTKAGNAEYEVESIRNWRSIGNRVEFLVKWMGYPVEQSTWEPYQHLARYGARRMLTSYVRAVNNNKLSTLVPAEFRPTRPTRPTTRATIQPPPRSHRT